MSVPLRTQELQRFSERWKVRFAEVPREPDMLGLAADAEQEQSVRRVEALFSTAKTALGALRNAEADSALAEAEALIRSHSGLPQAAWLLAEHHAILAERLLDEAPARARELGASAVVLEGERGQAFRDAASTSVRALVPALTEVQVSGLFARDLLEWDGEPARLPLATRPGEHHARVLRGERLLWSGWVTVVELAPTVTLSLPAPLACSEDDLSGTLDSEHGPRALPGTQCAEWAVARVKAGELSMARCQKAHCGPWQTGTQRQEATPSSTPSSGLPRWLTYAAIGAGAALITGVILTQTGAFSSNESGRERWGYTGFN